MDGAGSGVGVKGPFVGVQPLDVAVMGSDLGVTTLIGTVHSVGGGMDLSGVAVTVAGVTLRGAIVSVIKNCRTRKCPEPA